MPNKTDNNGNVLQFGLAARRRRRNNITLPVEALEGFLDQGVATSVDIILTEAQAEALLEQDSFVKFAAKSCGITLIEAHEVIEEYIEGFENAFNRVNVNNKGVIYSLALMSCYYKLFAEDIPEDIKPSLRGLLLHSLGQACSMTADRPVSEDAVE